MLGVRIAKRKIVNDPTQFEQVDETCEFGGAVLYSESLGITAFFENVVPSKYETQKLKQLQFGIENEKIRQFEHECLIRLFQWSFLPPGKALDFSVCDEAFGCYKTQYRKRYLLEICQNASFLSTPDNLLRGCGGTGRHSGLKIRWWKHHEGSIPFTRTICKLPAS